MKRFLLLLLALPGCQTEPEPDLNPTADDDTTDDTTDDDTVDDGGWGAIYDAAIPVSVVITVLDGETVTATHEGAEVTVPTAVGNSISIAHTAPLTQATWTRLPTPGARDATRRKLSLSGDALVVPIERAGSIRIDLCVVEVPSCGIGLASTSVVLDAS